MFLDERTQDEFISKFDAITLIEEMCDYYPYSEDAKSAAVRGILNMASANVKPEINDFWILERDEEGNNVCYHCSNCDSDFHNTSVMTASPYCPNCGATMFLDNILVKE